MKLISLLFLLPLSLFGAPIGGPISGGQSGLSSNTVYNMIITYSGSPTGGISAAQGSNIVAQNAILVANSGGINIALTNGIGYTNNFIRPSYSGGMTSTNAYPIVRATQNSSSSSQKLLEGYTGDTNAAAWTFVVTHGTNGYLPASPPSLGLRFTNINDNQFHYGYNLSQSPSYSASLPWWVRGHETVYFNPFNEPQMELYDRASLTNGMLSGQDVGFGYTVGLESGRIAANIFSDSLAFGHPRSSGQSWMSATCNSNNEGVLTLTKGYFQFFQNTNEWMISQDGTGIIGARGSNYLFSGGSTDDKMILFKGADPVNSDTMTMKWGSLNSRGLRWSQSNLRFEYQRSDATWLPFTQLSQNQKSYTIPANSTIGTSAGDFRRVGFFTNTLDLGNSLLEFNINFYADSAMTSQRYVVPINANDATLTSWEELLPAEQSSQTTSANFALDRRAIASYVFEFRLRALQARTSVNFGGTIDVYTYGNDTGDDAVFAVSTGSTGSGATVAGVALATPLAKLSGKVGINTNDPQATLHVVGNTWISGNAIIPWLGPAATNLIQLPTNAPTDGYSIVAAGTAGYTKFANVSSSPGTFTGNPNQFGTNNSFTDIKPFAIVTNMVNVFTNTGAFNFIARDTTPSGTTVFFGSDLSRNAWGIIGDLLYISGATVISNDAHITGSLNIDQNLNVGGTITAVQLDVTTLNATTLNATALYSTAVGNTNAFAQFGPNGNLTNNVPLSSANLKSAVTDETGSGALVFAETNSMKHVTAGTNNPAVPAIIVNGASTFNGAIAGTSSVTASNHFSPAGTAQRYGISAGASGATAIDFDSTSGTESITLRIADAPVVTINNNGINGGPSIQADMFISQIYSNNTGAIQAGLAYLTNVTGNITLAAPSSIPTGKFWSTTVAAKFNGAYTITMAGGIVDNGNGVSPGIVYGTNGQFTIIQISGYGNVFTNLLSPH